MNIKQRFCVLFTEGIATVSQREQHRSAPITSVGWLCGGQHGYLEDTVQGCSSGSSCICIGTSDSRHYFFQHRTYYIYNIIYITVQCTVVIYRVITAAVDGSTTTHSSSFHCRRPRSVVFRTSVRRRRRRRRCNRATVLHNRRERLSGSGSAGSNGTISQGGETQRVTLVRNTYGPATNIIYIASSGVYII